jgi:8-oxo-dGTP diphosphatase
VSAGDPSPGSGVPLGTTGAGLQPLASAAPTDSLVGVVAVILRQDRFLVIRRSPYVRAPGKYCFPGGGMAVQPVRQLWESITPWGVSLVWWHAEILPDAQLTPNPQEVAEVQWLRGDEMLALPELLESNRHFLAAHSWQTIGSIRTSART